MNDHVSGLRRLGPQDTVALQSFYNTLAPATIRLFRPLGPYAALDVCAQIVTESMLSPAPRYDLVACDRDTIIGWVFITGLGSDHPELGIAVTDRMHGQGLGTLLLTSILAWAREWGLGALYLIVVQDNQRALSMYQRYGFTIYDQSFDERDQLPYFHMVADLRQAATAS